MTKKQVQTALTPRSSEIFRMLRSTPAGPVIEIGQAEFQELLERLGAVDEHLRAVERILGANVGTKRLRGA